MFYFFVFVDFGRFMIVECGLEVALFVNYYCILAQGYSLDDACIFLVLMLPFIPCSSSSERFAGNFT
jgi:hypothetical protein